MFHLLLPAMLALSAASAPALAGPTPPRPDDPQAAVPETHYRSPQAYRPAEKPPTTPDRHWIEANRTVLGYNPMMLTMPERTPAPASAPVPGKTDKEAPAHDHAAHGRAHGHDAHAGHDQKGPH